MLLVSCSLDWEKVAEPNLPYWSTHLEIPLTTQSIGVDEIMESVDDPDSAISKIPKDLGGDSILYAFQKTEEIDRDTISFGNMGIDPFTDEMGSELGIIELSPIPETEAPSFKLGELNPSLNSLNGISATIPLFEIETIQKSFEFDNFQEATFENGDLIITIDNKLPIDLKDILIKLKKSDDTIIDQVSISEIPAGESKNGVINLEEKTLLKNILIEVNGESPGTGSEQVLIDINDYFVVKISSQVLEVSSAIAQIPEQSNPISGDGNMLLPLSEHRVANAVFERATLEIIINNQLDLASVLNMEIKNILDPLLQSVPIIIPLPRFESVIYTLNLSGYNFSLYEGNDFTAFNNGEQQQASYSYTVDMEKPDIGDFRTVSKTDQIEVSVRFYGDASDNTISFSQITGKIAQQKEEIGPITQSTPELPQALDDFLLLDEYVDMSLFMQIDNIGLPIAVNLTITAGNEDTSITHIQPPHDFSIMPEMKILNAAKIINIRPNSIVVTGEATVGDSTIFTTINLVDAIYMQGYFSIDIPFVFKVKSGTVVELAPALSTPVNFDALPVDIEDVETMQLMIDYNNQFGFGADISVLAATDTTYFTDTSSITPDTLVRSLFLDNKTESKDSLTFNAQQMELFKDSIYIKTNINIFGDEIFFISTDSFILKLSASMDYLINAPDSTGTDE